MHEREQTFLVRISKLFVSFSIYLLRICVLIVIPAYVIMNHFGIFGLSRVLIYCGIGVVFIFAVQHVPFLEPVRAYLRRMHGMSEQPKPAIR